MPTRGSRADTAQKKQLQGFIHKHNLNFTKPSTPYTPQQIQQLLICLNRLQAIELGCDRFNPTDHRVIFEILFERPTQAVAITDIIINLVQAGISYQALPGFYVACILTGHDIKPTLQSL